jgi:hypothetical protein
LETWYIEGYDARGYRVKWYDSVQDFDTVRMRLAEARKEGEVLRVSAPRSVAEWERDELRKLGVQLFEYGCYESLHRLAAADRLTELDGVEPGDEGFELGPADL